MRELDYEENGRLYRVAIPDDVPDSHAQYGIRLGPPDLDKLDLPVEVGIRLHNELFHRRLFTYADVRRRRLDVMGALQQTLALDVDRIVQIYMEVG